MDDIIADCQQIAADSSQIIQTRCWMMATGTMSAAEAFEMVAEKALAAQTAFLDGLSAGASGDPLCVMRAMVAPYRRKTAINVLRLCQ